ncbi:MAG: sporulation protein YqfD, partial [Clostridiales bacterium]
MAWQIGNIIEGYLEIDIHGIAPEKFLNLAMQNDILLKNALWLAPDKVRARVLLKDIYSLRYIARQSHCSFQIRKRWGLPFFLAAVSKRKAFLIGCFCFCLFFFLTGNLIFNIQVESPYPLKMEIKKDILQAAAQEGIKEGRLQWFINFYEVEKTIMQKFPNLIWLDISSRGTDIYISVVERSKIEEEDKPLPAGDIIASKDGIAGDILVHKGIPMVEKGDTIHQGQVLISGYDEKNQKIAASGIVNAKVWYRGYGECAMESRERKFTGREFQQIILKWNDQQQLLLSSDQIDFDL